VNAFVRADFSEVVAANIEGVRVRIAAACNKGHRNMEDVRLIAVSKNFSSYIVRMAAQCGVHDFGENRVQEAFSKFLQLNDIRSSIRVHFVGHLQTNKVKEALDICDIIHSVDSLKLVSIINERAARRVPVMLEVNVAGEETKNGFPVEEVDAAIKASLSLNNIDLIGLMTVAPLTDDPEDVRPIFTRLREINKRYGLRELSMGMTDDFEVAIEEGSTMVRIGRAIFGERSK
jgi:pyridoxal phosphate enzyme (YggS family)